MFKLLLLCAIASVALALPAGISDTKAPTVVELRNKDIVSPLEDQDGIPLKEEEDDLLKARAQRAIVAYDNLVNPVFRSDFGFNLGYASPIAHTGIPIAADIRYHDAFLRSAGIISPVGIPFKSGHLAYKIPSE